jgi:hypothetical protein
METINVFIRFFSYSPSTTGWGIMVGIPGLSDAISFEDPQGSCTGAGQNNQEKKARAVLMNIRL